MEENNFEWNERDLAHPGKRYQGQFIDGLIALSLFVLLLLSTKKFDIDNLVSEISIIAVPFLYFALSDALPNGQSIGKKLLGIHVVSKTTGKPCNVIQSFARNAFSPILGLLDAAFILSKKRQRLGDMLANTVVLKLKS